MTANKNASGTTRRPQQSRSQKTVAKILDASAQLLADKGYDGLNTNAVAQSAGVNISTLYSYFPNKEAILENLLERFNQTQLASAQTELERNTNKNERVGNIIDGQVNLMIEQPWMQALTHSIGASPQLRQLQEASQVQMIDLLIANIPPELGGPKVSGQQQRAVLQLLINVFGSGVELAAKTPKSQRPYVLAELKKLINSYLDNYR